MNASATTAARIAGIALVLVLAAVFGLIVGNLLALRDAGAAVGAGAAVRGIDWAAFHAQQGDVDGLGAPSYADPYLRIIEDAADAGRSTESLTAPTPR